MTSESALLTAPDENRLRFGQIASQYDRIRPGYPDELIDAGVRAGLTYREKLTRETSVAVSDAMERGAELRGKAMHAHRKEIPVVSGEEFARLVGQMESAE